VQVFCLLSLLVEADVFIPPRFKTTDCTGYELSGFWNLRHYVYTFLKQNEPTQLSTAVHTDCTLIPTADACHHEV